VADITVDGLTGPQEFWDLIAKINQQYPSAMAILQQPGVFQVYADAINGGWSGDRIEAAIEQTPWWKTTAAPARQWQALQATDPATAQQKITQYQKWIADASAATGVKLEDVPGRLDTTGFQFFNRAVTEGWTQDQIRYELLAAAQGNGGGDLGSAAAQIKSMANDYGVPLSDQTVLQYAKQLGQGAISPDSVKGYLIQQSKSLFPSMTAALDRGVTVKQFVDPYIQLAQQELDVNPNDVSLTDQKWMNVLNQVDPKTGARVPMTMDQALSTFRTDAAWGYDGTAQARQSATTLAASLQQKFGASA
jgi:hypothetical protein